MPNIAGYTRSYEVKGTKPGTTETQWFYMLTLGTDADGKRIQKKKRGFNSKRAAKKALDEARSKAYNDQRYNEEALTYGEYLHQWIREDKHQIGIQTRSMMERNLKNHIIPQLGNIKITDVNEKDLMKFITYLRNIGLADNTVHRIFSTVKSSLNDAYTSRVIKENPMSFVANKPTPKNITKPLWNESQLREFMKLLDNSNSRYGPAIYLDIFTGLRQGEILGLTWNNIDFENQSAKIQQVLTHDGKKFIDQTKTKAGERTISLNLSALALLKKHHQMIMAEKQLLGSEYKDKDLVFCTSHGDPCNPRNLSRELERLVSRLRITDKHCPKISFHGLRHTFATTLMQLGVHPKAVSELLGHKDIRLALDIYSRINTTMKKDAILQYEQFLLNDVKSTI